MSFYLGSDNHNQKIMHITKGTHELSQLNKEQFIDTIFHSGLNYLYMEKFTGSVSSKTLTVSALVKAELSGNTFILLNPSNNVVLSNMKTVVTNSGTIDYGEWNGLSMKLFDPLVDGTYTIYKLIPRPTNTSENYEILIGNGAIIIQGINLAQRVFLSPKKVNTVDASFLSGGVVFQLINSMSSDTDSLQIISNKYKTEILRNSNIIFSSNSSLNLEYVESSSLSFSSFIGTPKINKTLSKDYSLSSVKTQSSFAVAYIKTIDGYSSVFIPCNGNNVLVYTKTVNTDSREKVGVYFVSEPVYGWTTFTNYRSEYQCSTVWEYAWDSTANFPYGGYVYTSTEVCEWVQVPYDDARWEIQYYVETPYNIYGQVYVVQTHTVYASFNSTDIVITQKTVDTSYIEAGGTDKDPTAYPDYNFNIISYDGFSVDFDIYGI